MRTTLLLTLVLALAACNACKKSESKPNEVTTSGSGASGVGPASDGKVPPPGKAVDRATLDAISKASFGGGEVKVQRLDDDSLSVTLTPKVAAGKGPQRVRFQVDKCLNCVPMDKAQWEARKAELLLLVPAEIRDKPDTIYEIGEASVAGLKVVYIYQAGVHVVPNDTQTVSHAYTLRWNDGVNQIFVQAWDISSPTSASVAHLVTVVPRADLEAQAAAAFSEIAAKLPK